MYFQIYTSNTTIGEGRVDEFTVIRSRVLSRRVMRATRESSYVVRSASLSSSLKVNSRLSWGLHVSQTAEMPAITMSA